jgi:hypothetical protein
MGQESYMLHGIYMMSGVGQKGIICAFSHILEREFGVSAAP